MTRLLSIALYLTLTSAFALTPALAQRDTFQPEIAIEEWYVDNVGLGGSTTSSGSSATFTRLNVTLPWVREYRKASIRLVYAPAYEKYAEFDGLDHAEHNLGFVWNATPDARSRTLLDLAFARTQQQGSAGSDESPDLFVSARSDSDQFRGRFNFERGFARNWTGGFDLRAADYSFEPVDAEGLPDPSTVNLPSRTEYEVGAVFHHTGSARGRLGVEYSFKTWDFESGWQDDVHIVAATWHRQVSRSGELELSAGAFARDSVPGPVVPVGFTESEEGIMVSAGLTQRFRRVVLGLSALRSPSAGSAFDGATVTTAAAVRLSKRTRLRWNWNLDGRFSHRDTGTLSGEVDTTSIGGSVERGFGSKAGLRLSANWVDQTVEFGEDASFFNAGLGLVWYPLGSPSGRGN